MSQISFESGFIIRVKIRPKKFSSQNLMGASKRFDLPEVWSPFFHVIILMHVLASLKQLTGAASATRYTIRPFRGGLLPNFRLNSCLMFSMATMSWHNFTPTTKGNQEKVVTLNLISRIIAYFLDWTHHLF